MRALAAALVLAGCGLTMLAGRVARPAWTLEAPPERAARARPRKAALAPAAGAAVGALLGFVSPYLLVPGAIAGAAVPAGRARTHVKAAARARAATVPALVDLVAVATAAGHTPATSLVRAAAYAPAGAQRMLAGAVSALALGADLAAATRETRGVDAGLDALLDILVRGASLGSPVAPQLADLASRLRTEQLRAAQEHARTVPVRLLFPLVLLVLPSFVLLGVVPLLLGTATGLRSP